MPQHYQGDNDHVDHLRDEPSVGLGLGANRVVRHVCAYVAFENSSRRCSSGLGSAFDAARDPVPVCFLTRNAPLRLATIPGDDSSQGRSSCTACRGGSRVDSYQHGGSRGQQSTRSGLEWARTDSRGRGLVRCYRKGGDETAGPWFLCAPQSA